MGEVPESINKNFGQLEWQIDNAKREQQQMHALEIAGFSNFKFSFGRDSVHFELIRPDSEQKNCVVEFLYETIVDPQLVQDLILHNANETVAEWVGRHVELVLKSGKRGQIHFIFKYFHPLSKKMVEKGFTVEVKD